MSLWSDITWSPMLLKETDKVFSSKDYIFEIKFDGLRACIFVSPNYFKIMNRHNKDITYLYPELSIIKKLVKCETIFDGEIVVMEKNGPSFSKLQERSHLKDKTKIKIQSEKNPVIFVCFDILYQNKNLINLKILERKKILNQIRDNDFFIKSKVYNYDGEKLFKSIKKLNLEGVVAKKIDSTYKINSRSDAWIKIKNNMKEEFFIGGYEVKKNGLSLLLGEIIGDKLNYVGSVILSKNRSLYKEVLNKKIIGKSPFIGYERENAKYISPKLKCMVKYMQRTKTNHLRQPFISK